MGKERKEPSARARHLLKVLIERYVQEGKPVGSRQLALDSGLNLSPASIRNILSDLENLGLVTAPHTSAGRVPTTQGYRLFVDQLIAIKPLRSREVDKLRQEINADHDPNTLLSAASDMLSGITRMSGIVTTPRRSHERLRHVEFLPLSEQRVLAIMVMNESEVQNRILHTNRSFDAAELQMAANYLNSLFSGEEVSSIRERLVDELRAARSDVGDTMRDLVMATDELFPDTDAEDLLLSGQNNLLEFEDIAANVDRLKELFQVLNQKQDILQVLDQCLGAEGVQIYIGSESGSRLLGDMSLVTSRYCVDGELVGVLGVIGPTRMAYDRIIPVVDATAKLLGAALDYRK